MDLTIEGEGCCSNVAHYVAGFGHVETAVMARWSVGYRWDLLGVLDWMSRVSWRLLRTVRVVRWNGHGGGTRQESASRRSWASPLGLYQIAQACRGLLQRASRGDVREERAV